jgi:hypothetical protein
MNTIEKARMELAHKRRELTVEHRIFMAVKRAKEEQFEYIETLINHFERAIKELKKDE